MTIAVALATVLLVGATRARRARPGPLQSIAELSYEFVAGWSSENVGAEGTQYFPLVFSLFMFILFGNLLGLIPYSFTFTGRSSSPSRWRCSCSSAVTLIGFIRHGFHFFTLFFPPGAPIVMAPLLVPIEIISYLIAAVEP